jgi:hypothetical protein
MLKTIDTDFRQLKNADTIEEILCLSVLIATNRLKHSATAEDARDYFDSIGVCDACPVYTRCLACIINE